MRCHEQPLRIGVPVLLFLGALAGACGGGGGGDPTDPGSGTPEPVAEITEADLADAGIPGPAALVEQLALRVHTRLAADYNADGVVDGADFLIWQGVVPLDEGGGFEIRPAPADAGGRIVAWAIYELSTPAGSHLAWLEADAVRGDDRVPLFYAVANAGTVRWEIGGRLHEYGWDTWHWHPDGTRDTSTSPSFRRSLSMGQEYVWADGGSYLLVAVGNPGPSEADGVTVGLDLGWSAILGESEEAYDLGEEGSCAWSADIGGGIYNLGTLYAYIEQGNGYRQVFGGDHLAAGPRMLFAQPMNIRVDGKAGDDVVTRHGVTDAIDYTVWRCAFFDPGELNGVLHPFTLHAGDGPSDDLNVAPLLDLDEAGTTRGIIGILVGLKGPVEGAQVDMLTAGDQISLTTGKAGIVAIPDPADGAHELQVSYSDEGGEPVRLTYQFLVDTTAGTYRIR